MHSDVLHCLDFLIREVPGWSALLVEIAAGHSRRRVDIEKASDSDVGPQPAPAPVTALPTPELDGSREASESSEIIQREDSPLENVAAMQQSQRSAKRKRSLNSTISSHPSHPRKSRTRSLAIVYYDSHAQSSLENLVRSFDVARNLVKKALAAVNELAITSPPTTPSISGDGDIDTDAGELDATVALSKIRARLRRDQRMVQLSSEGLLPKREVLATATVWRAELSCCDEALKEATSTCEDAAFRLLRDGQCQTEFDSMESRFAYIRRLCQKLDGLKEYKSARSTADLAPHDSHKAPCTESSHILELEGQRKGNATVSTGKSLKSPSSTFLAKRPG